MKKKSIINNSKENSIKIPRFGISKPKKYNQDISTFFNTFAGLIFDENESKKHFQNIVKLKESFKEKLNRDVGLKVALLDYFSNIDNKLKNPKIIEMDIFNELLKSSKIDEKTGLININYFKNIINMEINRAKRNKFSLSLLFIDIDNFKDFNDQFGHTTGDLLLKHLADIMQKTFRREDVCARFGAMNFSSASPY